MIFANHAHIIPGRENGDINSLIKFMDEVNVDRAVCFAPFINQVKNAGIMEHQNKWLAKEIKGNDRVVGFGTIDFENNLEDEVELIADLGFKGIKLHPPYQEFKIDGEEAFRVYAKAEELGLSCKDFLVVLTSCPPVRCNHSLKAPLIAKNSFKKILVL